MQISHKKQSFKKIIYDLHIDFSRDQLASLISAPNKKKTWKLYACHRTISHISIFDLIWENEITNISFGWWSSSPTELSARLIEVLDRSHCWFIHWFFISSPLECGILHLILHRIRATSLLLIQNEHYNKSNEINFVFRHFIIQTFRQHQIN